VIFKNNRSESYLFISNFEVSDYGKRRCCESEKFKLGIKNLVAGHKISFLIEGQLWANSLVNPIYPFS
jgi:hypothetical protein